MAKEKDHTKTILIIGGLALGAYVLTRPSVKEKLQEGMSGYFPQFSFAPIDISEFGMPSLEEILKECQAPSLNDLFKSEFPNLLPDFPNIFNPEGDTTLPPEHATWTDVAYTLPSYAKGAIAVVAAGLAGYGGYHAIRVTAPVLRAIGTQAARGIGGTGNLLKGLFTRNLAARASGTVIKNVPMATTAARTGTGGFLGGILPALAFTGIMEGGYQIFRLITGAQQVGMTGVPPLDIINLIMGKFKPWQPAPNLLFPSFGVAEAAPPSELVTPVTYYSPFGPLSAFPSFGVAAAAPPSEPTAPTSPLAGYTGYKSLIKQPSITVIGPPPEVVMAKMLAQE